MKPRTTTTTTDQLGRAEETPEMRARHLARHPARTAASRRAEKAQQVMESRGLPTVGVVLQQRHIAVSRYALPPDVQKVIVGEEEEAFAPFPVKREDDEEEELHQRPTQHMETEADGEDCGGPEPARNSHPLLQPETEDQTGDSSEPDADDSADWKETREPQSALNSLKHDSRRKKRFSCSECGRRFSRKENLNRHMITHTGEKPFSCSVCKKSFTQRGSVRSHMRIHTGEKRFSCSVCNKRFARRFHVETHKCVGPMETEADGEDCGGPEPARNSHPLLQSETKDQTGDSSDPETDDSADWKETREPQSALNSLKHDSRCKKPFSCSECGKRFSFKSDLKRHMITHTGEKAFSCSECGRRYSRKEHLKTHMMTHRGERPFNCSVCEASFTRSERLKIHMRSHTGEKPFSCSVCNTSFTHSGSLQKHMRIHTGDKPFSCSVCKKSFTQSGDLHKHMRIHTGEKPFSCSECVKAFSDSGTLKKHMRTHTGEKTFGCSLCGKGFILKGQLAYHMKHHRGEKPSTSCVSDVTKRPEAPQIKEEQEELWTNQEGEPDTDDSADWKETTDSQSALNSMKHIECNTDKSSCSINLCSECGKQFRQESNLKNHMRIHKGDKPFSCSACGKRCMQKAHLTYHMTRHTGEKIFCCSVCDKRFIRLYQLRKHKCPSQTETEAAGNSHPQTLSQPETEGKVGQSIVAEIEVNWDDVEETGELDWTCDAAEKQFSCSECGKRFSRKTHLQRHVMTHTGERPFGCSVCRRSFTESGNLRKHMAVHTGEKHFSCGFCEQRFTWHSQLQSHECDRPRSAPRRCQRPADREGRGRSRPARKRLLLPRPSADDLVAASLPNYTTITVVCSPPLVQGTAALHTVAPLAVAGDTSSNLNQRT